MQISILAFDGLTALDAVGPYEVLRSVPNWEVAFVGKERGEVRTDVGSLGLSVDHDFEERPEADVVLVPGGEGNRKLLDDDQKSNPASYPPGNPKLETFHDIGKTMADVQRLVDGLKNAK